MHGKYACLGLLLLALAALVIIPDAAAYPSKNSACEVCHSANQPKSISISQIDIASTNVNPGQLFNVGVTWLGGNAAGSTTVKWPNVLNNNLFTINPVQVNGATSDAGSFALTAPAAHGNYTIRVYATT